MKKIVALLLPSLVAHGAPDPEFYFDRYHNMYARSLDVLTPLNTTVTEFLSYPCSHIVQTEAEDTLELESPIEKPTESTSLLERKGTTSMVIEVEQTGDESSEDTTEVPKTGKKSSRAPNRTWKANAEKGVLLKWTPSKGNVQKKDCPKSKTSTYRRLQYQNSIKDVGIMTAVLTRIQGEEVVSKVIGTAKRVTDKEYVHSALRRHIVSLGGAASPLFADLTDVERKACFYKKAGRKPVETQDAPQTNINNLLD